MFLYFIYNKILIKLYRGHLIVLEEDVITKKISIPLKMTSLKSLSNEITITDSKENEENDTVSVSEENKPDIQKPIRQISSK